MKRNILIFLLLLVNISFAGESMFGLVDNGVGFLKTISSAAGQGRSYEMAVNDSVQLNYRNYANWTSIPNTSFTIKFGYDAIFSDDLTNDYYGDAGNFQGGYLAIPILQRKLILGGGIQPISKVEQRIVDKTSYDSSATTVIKENLLMDGGLDRALLNLSYRFNLLSVSLGWEYTFGNITENLVLDIEDNTTSRLFLNYDNLYSGHGMVINAFTDKIKDVNLGVTIRPAVDLDLERKGDSNSEIVDKTQKSTVTLPAEYNLGIEYQISNRLAAGMDVMYQDWKNGYKIDGNKVENYEKYYKIGVGIERKSSEKRFINMGQQIDYRMGLYLSQLNITRNEEPVKEYGLSLGFSLPIQRFRSRIDFSGIVGKRGSLSTNGLEETFVSFGISVSASEKWFVKLDK